MVKKITSFIFLLTDIAVASGVASADTLQPRNSNVAQSTATLPKRVRERTDVKVPMLGWEVRL